MRRLIIALLILTIAVAGCGEKSADDTGNFGVAGKGADLSDVPQALLDLRDVEPVEEVTTSEDLLEAALEEEEIDIGEYAALQLRADVAPATLPKEYQGDVAGRDDSLAIQYALEHWDEMSAEDQEELRPYTLSPMDPESYWYDADDTFEGSVEQQESAWLASPLKKAYDWLEIIPAVAAIKHAHPSGHIFMISTTDMNKFNIVANSLKKAHDKYKDEMGMPEPDEWIIIKLRNIPAPPGKQTYGKAWMADFEGKRRCNILINKNLGEKDLKVTAAHELFHCFQFHVPLKISGNVWLLESTATWAEEYIYPNINSEHEYDKDIFPHFSKRFTDKSGLREYGSYLWWFYIYQVNGKTPYDIKNSLFARKAMPNQEAMLMERPAWHAEHKEYALWNVNRGIAKFYQDYDSRPSWTPFPPSYKEGQIVKEVGMTEDIEILPGGIKYYYYTVDDSIDKLRFDLKEINGIEDSGVQVIYNVGGQEYIRDVSFQDELVFCRKRPNEKVDVILFIISNSDLTAPLSSEIPNEPFDKCAPGWHGTVSYVWGTSGDTSMPTFTGEAIGNWAETGSYYSQEELVYDKDEDEFLLKKQTSSYSYGYNQQVTFTKQPCGTKFKSRREMIAGGGTVKWDIDEGALWKAHAPTRLNGNEDGTYELNLKHFAGGLYSTDDRSYERIQCLGEGIALPDQGEGNAETFSDRYDNNEAYTVIQWPNYEMELRLSEDKKSLMGTGEAYFQYDNKKVPVNLFAEFHYD